MAGQCGAGSATDAFEKFTPKRFTTSRSRDSRRERRRSKEFAEPVLQGRCKRRPHA
jgi:hypothetical protein